MTRVERGNTKAEFAILVITSMVRECLIFRLKIYYFSYQSLNGICEVQPNSCTRKGMRPIRDISIPSSLGFNVEAFSII